MKPTQLIRGIGMCSSQEGVIHQHMTYLHDQEQLREMMQVKKQAIKSQFFLDWPTLGHAISQIFLKVCEVEDIQSQC